MRHFSLKTLLVTVTMFALWFSTFKSYRGAADVRAFILTAVVLMSAMAAIYHSGRRRAFWLGFVGTQLLMSTRQIFPLFGARFDWALRSSRDWSQVLGVQPGQGDFVLGVHLTLIYGVILFASLVIGLLCMTVYDEILSADRKD